MDPQADLIQRDSTIFRSEFPCLPTKTNPNLQFLCSNSAQGLPSDPISSNSLLFRQNPEKPITCKFDVHSADMYESHIKTHGSSLSRSDQGSLSSNDITSLSPAKPMYLLFYFAVD